MKIESIKYQHISRGHYNVVVNGKVKGCVIGERNKWYFVVDDIAMATGITRGGTVQTAIDEGWLSSDINNPAGENAYYSCDSCGIELNGEEAAQEMNITEEQALNGFKNHSIIPSDILMLN